MPFFSTEPRKRKPSVKSTWARIDKWLAKNLPQVSEALNPPATEEQIAQFEKVTRRQLPRDVRDSLRIHNGQRDVATGVVFGLLLLPLDRVLSDWEAVRTLEDDGAEYEYCTSKPKKAVQLCQNHPGWIPLIADWSGSHLGVDTAPGVAGTTGQVINFGRSEDQHFAISLSWGDFLADMMDQFASGNVIIDTEDEEFIDFKLKAPRNDHFGDALPQLYKQSLKSAG